MDHLSWNDPVCLPLQVSWRNSRLSVQLYNRGGDRSPRCLYERVPERAPIKRAVLKVG